MLAKALVKNMVVVVCSRVFDHSKGYVDLGDSSPARG